MIELPTESEPVRVVEGDCLDVLRSLPDGCVDAVVTDPPYIIGATSVGNPKSKSGTWADMENAAWWFAEWYRLSAKTLKPSGYLATFGNWRSLPTIICAGAKAGLSAASCVAWDKEWIGPAHAGQFRPTWELIVLFGMSESRIADRSESDVWRCKWMAGNSGRHDHPAEKPVELMRRLIRHLSPSGGLIVDPFAGSGTTGVAAALENRRCLLIEKEPAYAKICRERVAKVLDPGLFAEAAG